ncbi:MAG: NADH:ubiquinone oxidoreductase 17.2 kD subunit, partial [uncultured Sphingomonas sp.]
GIPRFDLHLVGRRRPDHPADDPPPRPGGGARRGGQHLFRPPQGPAATLGDLPGLQRRQPDSAGLVELAARADRRRARQVAAPAASVREAGGGEPDRHRRDLPARGLIVAAWTAAGRDRRLPGLDPGL